jgi:hypothetical protein
MLKIKGESLILGATRDRVILDGQCSVEEGLSLTAKLVLNASQGATLVRNALEVIILNTLRQIGEGLLARELNSAAKHVNEDANHVLDAIDRGIATGRQISETDVIGLGKLAQDNSPGRQSQVSKSHRALLAELEQLREALEVHHNSLEFTLKAKVGRMRNMARTHSSEVLLPVI